MSKVRFRISVSLDGYMAGPNQGEEHPLGEGGEALHEWALELRAWRESHGREGGVDNPSSAVIDDMTTNIGAVIMGRNMFGPVRGPWDAENPWNGWWGDDPPFDTPVFVLTHHAREPLTLGEITFNFVTDGADSALAQAREAAGEKEVTIGGGAETIQEYLAAGEVDEMTLSIVPILLGGGERLLEGLGDTPPGFELVRVIDAPGVTHLKFAVGQIGKANN